jgi:hypothetical protein
VATVVAPASLPRDTRNRRFLPVSEMEIHGAGGDECAHGDGFG